MRWHARIPRTFKCLQRKHRHHHPSSVKVQESTPPTRTSTYLQSLHHGDVVLCGEPRRAEDQPVPLLPQRHAKPTPSVASISPARPVPLPNVTAKATEKPKIATTREHRSEPKPGAQRPPSALSNAAGPAPRSPASTTAPRRTRGVYATAPFARPLLPVVPPHKAEVSATTPHNSSSARTPEGAEDRA